MNWSKEICIWLSESIGRVGKLSLVMGHQWLVLRSNCRSSEFAAHRLSLSTLEKLFCQNWRQLFLWIRVLSLTFMPVLYMLYSDHLFISTNLVILRSSSELVTLNSFFFRLGYSVFGFLWYVLKVHYRTCQLGVRVWSSVLSSNLEIMRSSLDLDTLYSSADCDTLCCDHIWILDNSYFLP